MISESCYDACHDACAAGVRGEVMSPSSDVLVTIVLTILFLAFIYIVFVIGRETEDERWERMRREN
jgi:hypothetical protein